MAKEENKKNFTVMRLAMIGIFAALSYIGFQVLRIDIVVGADKTAFHLGNTFLVVAALFLGPVDGAIAGSLGMTLADLTSGYAMYAPKTLILKLCIGLIVGLVAHKIGHLSQCEDRQQILKWSALASTAGMVFNIVADPSVGYLYKRYLLKVSADAASILAKMAALTTSVNAVLAVVLAVIIYQALLPLRKKVIAGH